MAQPCDHPYSDHPQAPAEPLAGLPRMPHAASVPSRPPRPSDVGVPPLVPDTAEEVLSVDLFPQKELMSVAYGEEVALPDLSEWPLFKAAHENRKPLRGVKAEWLVERILPGGGWRREVWFNYTQIFRQTFQRRFLVGGRWESLEDAKSEALRKMLGNIELTLWHGRRCYDLGSSLHFPISTCGGVLHHFAKRRIYENDSVSLRELRPIVFLPSRGALDRFIEEEKHIHELLCEVSLQVNPGHYERGMKPLFLPPKVKPVKAWRQGASLDDKE